MNTKAVYLTLFLIQLALCENLFARVQRPDRRQKAVQGSQGLLDFVPGQEKHGNGQCTSCHTTMVEQMSNYNLTVKSNKQRSPHFR
jgi:hypothetical protein